MKSKLLKISVFILLLVFYGSLLLHKIELPAADDIARHIKNGELILQGQSDVLYSNYYSYTEPGYHFINHHWLSGVFFYLLYKEIGWGGLVIFKIIISLLTFTLIFRVSIKKACFWLVTFFSIPTTLILGERATLRPEIFSYFFIAAFLYLLTDLEEYPERKRIFWLIPIQIFWVNMHLFFIVGLVLVAGFLIEKIVLNYRNLNDNKLVKKLAILLLILAAVSFVNPNGEKGAFYPLQIFHNYGMEVIENNSPTSFLKSRPLQDNISILVFFWSIFTLAASFLFNLNKRPFNSVQGKPIFYFLVSVAAATGGFIMLRLMPLFSLIFLPAVSANFNESFFKLENIINKKAFSGIFKKALAIVFIIALCCLIYLEITGKFSSYKKNGIGLTSRSNDSADFFKEQGLHGPIFNGFDIGSYLIYHLYPVKSDSVGVAKRLFDGVNSQEKVFVDNRPEAYSASFLTDTYSAIKKDENKWQEALEQYKFNVIFLYIYETDLRQFTYRRIHDSSWSLVYADSYGVILLRNNKDNEEIIKKFQITKKNIGQRLQPLLQSENYEDQVVAADIFNLFDRFDLAKKTFLRIVERWPEKGKIWMLLGEMEYNKDSESAVTYMEKAIAVGYKTAEAYDYLGRAYLWTHEYKKAEKSFQKALKINPDYEESTYLKQLLQWLWFQSPTSDQLPDNLK